MPDNSDVIDQGDHVVAGVHLNVRRVYSGATREEENGAIDEGE